MLQNARVTAFTVSELVRQNQQGGGGGGGGGRCLFLLSLYVCKETFLKLCEQIPRKLLGLRVQNFQGIIFI